MRLQAEGAPDTADGRLRHLHLARHGARAPVCCIGGLRFQRLGNHRVDPRIINASRCAVAGRIEQSIQPRPHETGAPFRHRWRGHRELMGHVLVVHAVGALKNDARTQRQGLRRLTSPRPGLQLFGFRFVQHQFRLRSACHRSALAVSNTFYERPVIAKYSSTN